MNFHKIIRIAEHPARADKSGLEMHYATFGYASLWLMQRGDGRDKSAPTDGRSILFISIIVSAQVSLERRKNLLRAEKDVVTTGCR
jgi:hypothetical protein